jgi:hypothetical protein
MRLAWNLLKRVTPKEHAPWTGTARRALRAHRVITVGCAFVLLSAGVGATTYVKIDGHAMLAAAGKFGPSAQPAAKSTAASAATAAKPSATANSTASPGTAAHEDAQAPGPATVPKPAPTTTATSATVSNPLTGQPFSGVAQVGAVFDSSDGSPTSHHCTGSVVDSPAGDIVITAAHCVYGSGPAANQEFVPAYDNGSMPYGVWKVSAVYVASQWASGRDPDYDVAFLVVHNANGSSTPIQDVVGGDALAVDQSYTPLTTVIGYPSDTNQPVTCTNYTTEFTSTQLQWDCDNYPDGTSGSPFLTGYNPQTGVGTVVGVIGGYQTGGDTPNVSYSVRFGDAVSQLLAQAEASNGASN